MHKAYLFDFDGTLVDSMPTWSEKVLGVLRACEISYPDGILKILTPLGDAGVLRYYREKMGVTLSDEEMTAMMDAYALPRYRDEIPLKAGVLDYLLRLRAAGISVNVLTASPHKMLDPCLLNNGIFHLFDHVWSSDDFPSTKADPKTYLEACARLGILPEETVFLDDNVGAVRAAAEAGLFTVGVYDASGESFTEELRAAADAYSLSFENEMIF